MKPKHIQRLLPLFTAFLFALLAAGLPFSVPARAAAPALSQYRLTMVKGGSKTLKMKNISSSAKVTWKSTNTKIASVTSKGKVTAKAKGIVKIQAKTGGNTYSCKLTVVVGTISQSKVSLTAGKTTTLRIKGTSLTPSWSSSDKTVASVSSKGAVTAKKAGTATITAKIQGKKYTCKMTVKKAAAPGVTYKTYKDPDGYFTMSIPKNWKVQTGLMGAYDQPVDLISYGIRAYDPNVSDRCVYFCLNTIGLKSEKAKTFNVSYYDFVGNSTMKQFMEAMPVITETSTRGFFRGMQSQYGMKDFTVSKNLGKGATGGDVLRATATSKGSGKKVEGLFTAYATADTNMTYDTIFGLGTVDTGYAYGWSIGMERARQGEFTEWQPVLDHVMGSIKFTDKFQSDRKEVWENVMGTASYQQAKGSEISDIIMAAWEKRNK